MKEKIKTFFAVCILVLAIPYIVTLLFQGNETSIGEAVRKEGQQDSSGENGKAGETQPGQELNVEQYLPGVLAAQISLDSEMETLKAQAVAARTAVHLAIEQNPEAPKLPRAMSTGEMMDAWGQKNFDSSYRILEQAVSETEGQILTSGGKTIEAAYHAVSAGRTRSAKEALGREDEPWLGSVESKIDITSEEYLKVIFLEKKEIADKLKQAYPDLAVGEADLPGAINLSVRDSSDYVQEVQISGKTLTGEEFRQCLGLNSACFYLKEVEGQVRIVTKGLGHGLGISQYGANELAKQGKNYKDILSYYYTGAEVTEK